MQPDAVFRRHGAVERPHHAVQLGFYGLAFPANRCAIGGDVQIAIAHMAEKQREVTGPARIKCCLNGVGKLANLGLGQAHVKVDGRVHMGVQLGRCFAQLPQRFGLGLRLRDHRIDHVTRLHGFPQGLFHGFAQTGFVFAIHIDQRQERVALGKRRLQVLPLHRGLHKVVPHQLKRGHAVAKAALHALQHRQGLVKTGHGHQSSRLGLGHGAQAQQHARDDAQRAFRTDKELLEVVARVVLDHRAQHGQHRAVGQHHFQPQHLLAHHAVLQHAVAARVGGHIATNLAAAARAQVHAKHQACLDGGLLHSLQGGPGLHLHHGGAGVDVFDRVHALQRNGYAAFHRYGTTGQAGQAALGHHGHAVRVAQAQRSADFFGAARAHQGPRRHGGRAAPVGVVAGLDRITHQHHLSTQCLLQIFDKLFLGHDSTFHGLHCHRGAQALGWDLPHLCAPQVQPAQLFVCIKSCLKHIVFDVTRMAFL